MTEDDAFREPVVVFVSPFFPTQPSGLPSGKGDTWEQPLSTTASTTTTNDKSKTKDTMTKKKKSKSGGKKNKHGSKNKGSDDNDVAATNNSSSSWLYVDPARVRFQHSKIRPYFSGCGRSVYDTLEEIRSGKIRPEDLPPIQVLIGPVDKDSGEPWYFSLNNRRLWVLKRCREEGLLERSHNNNNKIRVRVRQPKSQAERERYTIEKCAVEAKFLREAPPKQSKTNEERAEGHDKETNDEGTTTDNQVETAIERLSVNGKHEPDDNDDDTSDGIDGHVTDGDTDDDSDEDGTSSNWNPYAALM